MLDHYLLDRYPAGYFTQAFKLSNTKMAEPAAPEAVPKRIPTQLKIMQPNPQMVDYPQTTYYQSHVPQTFTQANVIWTINNPGSGYLLDAFATVRYKIRVTRNRSTPHAGQIGECFSRSGIAFAANAPANIDFGNGSAIKEKVALRQNFPMVRAIQNATLTMNGQNVSVRPNEWIDVMNRIYLSHEDSKNFATISAGYYDNGDYSNTTPDMTVSMDTNDIAGHGIRWTPVGPQGGGVAAGVAVQVCPNIAPYTYFRDESDTAKIAYKNLVANQKCNKGFEQRLANFYEAGIAQRSREEMSCFFSRGAATIVAPDGNLPNLADGRSLPKPQAGEVASWGVIGRAGALDGIGYVELELNEPIPISPFAFYPSRGLDKSIPHIREFTLQYDFVSDIASAVLQTFGGDEVYARALEVGTKSAFHVELLEPQLNLRWYRPNYAIPPQVALQHFHMMTFHHSFAIPKPPLVLGPVYPVSGINTTGVSTNQVSFSNIRLPSIPDLLLIYFKNEPTETDTCHPSDDNLAIGSIQMSIDGVSGRVLAANSAELYRMYLSNSVMGTKSTYTEWFKYHCCAVLTPTDYGVSPPEIMSSKRGVTLNIDQIEWINFWRHPNMGQRPTRDRGAPRQFSILPGVANMRLFVQCIWRNKSLIMTDTGEAALRI